MPEMTLQELTKMLGGELTGDGSGVVRGVASLEEAGPDEIGFLANAKYTSQVGTSKAAAVIVPEDYDGPGDSLIRCEDSYFAYRQAMVAFYGFRKPTFAGVSPSASIDASAEIADGVTVGPFVTVSPGVTVAAGTVLYPGVFVGPGCKIGANCTIYPNVTLYDKTILGDRVTVHAGSSVGQDGFGYATHPNADGVVVHDKIPQAGWVELEDDVEIGACCSIDRATMGATVIGAGTKFSNQIAIGHGTKMGKHCLMVAQAGIAGSTMVGNYCVFAGQAGVVGHIRIGDGVRVGAQAGVTNDIEPGIEVLGSPAMPRAEARRVVMAATRVPELRNTVKKLMKQLKAVQDRLTELEGNRPGAE
ncbi:MAG: UDP-3-O-(3-hydroxymyristoyl)glucosamine N-acyltransferase [Phycisphaerae bacterium]|nr:UDP-3-O-(3-hydroxymyristoyl)glucosamine N-acyltransferase [Phycisphaerae bacterium]